MDTKKKRRLGDFFVSFVASWRIALLFIRLPFQSQICEPVALGEEFPRGSRIVLGELVQDFARFGHELAAGWIAAQLLLRGESPAVGALLGQFLPHLTQGRIVLVQVPDLRGHPG